MLNKSTKRSKKYLSKKLLFSTLKGWFYYNKIQIHLDQDLRHKYFMNRWIGERLRFRFHCTYQETSCIFKLICNKSISTYFIWFDWTKSKILLNHLNLNMFGSLYYSRWHLWPINIDHLISFVSMVAMTMTMTTCTTIWIYVVHIMCALRTISIN